MFQHDFVVALRDLPAAWRSKERSQCTGFEHVEIAAQANRRSSGKLAECSDSEAHAPRRL
jgi:hypothetical protein